MTETRIVNRHDEPYDIYIGRGTLWGNPFIRGTHGDLPMVLEKYEEHMRRMLAINFITKEELCSLKGRVLGCSCKPKPCHGDILVKLIDEFC